MNILESNNATNKEPIDPNSVNIIVNNATAHQPSFSEFLPCLRERQNADEEEEEVSCDSCADAAVMSVGEVEGEERGDERGDGNGELDGEGDEESLIFGDILAGCALPFAFGIFFQLVFCCY